jgi:hypothetical protein
MRAALLALAACASAAKPANVAPPVSRPAPVAVRHEPWSRPPLALAAVLPARDPAWPLTELPSLQPHLDLMMAHDACSGALAARHAGDAELLAYVSAWCRVRAGDRSAVDDLGRLARDARRDLARAARLDFVNLVADDEPARDALHHLGAIGLDSPELYDLLAGTYVALDQPADAAIAAARVPRTSCERVLAWSMLDAPGLDHAVARFGLGTDDCAARARFAACMLRDAGNEALIARCTPPDEGDPQLADKVAVWHAYGVWGGDAGQMISIAHQLAQHLVVAGAEQLAVAALDDAVRASSCEPAIASVIAGAARELRDAEHYSGRYDAQVAAMAALTPEQCRTYGAYGANGSREVRRADSAASSAGE